MQAWAFPATVTVDEEGGYTFQFTDMPEGITGAATLEEARALAPDCLDVVVQIRLERGEEVPAPRSPREGEELVPLEPVTAARAALAQAMAAERLTNVALANRMGKSEGAVRRIVSGRGRVKMDTVMEALAATGRRGVFATL